MENFRERIGLTGGFVSSQPAYGEGMVPHSVGGNSFNMVLTANGVFEPFKGFQNPSLTGGKIMFDMGDAYSFLDSGNIVMSAGRSLWWVGSGTAKFYSAATGLITLGDATAAGGLLKFNVKSGGSYLSARTAGLAAPAAGSLEARDITGGFTGKLTGTRSVKFTIYRPAEGGGESRPSPASAVVNFDAQYARVTFPDSSYLVDGATKFRLYITPEGNGKDGPWLFYGEYALADLTLLSGTTYYKDLEWYDGELFDETPDDFFVPTAATHFVQFGNVGVLVGTYNGIGVTSSIPNYLEAYPPSNTSWLPEPVVSVSGKPADGVVYVLMNGAVAVLVWTGAPDGPAVIPRVIWNDIGVQSQTGAVSVKGQLYAFTASKGIVRTGDDFKADYDFAARVKDTVKDWDASLVAVGFSPVENAVVFAHKNVCLMYHIDLDAWSTPIKLVSFRNAINGDIESFHVRQGQLYVSVNNVGTHTLYGFNKYAFGGAGNPLGSEWQLQSAWYDAKAGLYQKTLTRLINTLNVYGTAPNNSITTKVFKNLSTSPSYTKAITLTGNETDFHGKWQKLNVRNCKTFSVMLAGIFDPTQAISPPAVHKVYGTEVHGVISRIRV